LTKDGGKLFFFIKKNFFTRWAVPAALSAPGKPEKSLFASFSSEKEDSFFCFCLARKSDNP
jgi:hypothetical protein